MLVVIWARFSQVVKSENESWVVFLVFCHLKPDGSKPCKSSFHMLKMVRHLFQHQ